MFLKAEAAKIREEVMRWVKQHAVPSLFQYTISAKGSADGDEDQAETTDEATDAGQPKGERPGARIQPFGFTGVPTNEVRVFGLKLGASNVVFLGIGPQRKYGPGGLESGETSVWNFIAGCYAKLTKLGHFQINSGTPQGGSQGDVVVNGGTKKVARVDDTTTNGTIEILGGVGNAFTGIKYIAPDGTVTTINATGIQATIAGKINSGADHFKA